MFSNYFKVAVRSILRHKVYSIINIAGFSRQNVDYFVKALAAVL